MGLAAGEQITLDHHRTPSQEWIAMKKYLIFLMLIGLTLGASFANTSVNKKAESSQFSSPAAATAFATNGDMSAAPDISLVANSFLGGDTVTMARTAGCTVSCTGGCTAACTNTCTTRCRR